MSIRALPRRKFSAIETMLKREDWLPYLLDIPDAVLKDIHQPASNPKHRADAQWFQEQAEERIRQVSRTVQMYAPWLLPELVPLKDVPAIYPLGGSDGLPVLQRVPGFIDKRSGRLS